jgi:prepilin-type processing-associated H-X9-DG protein
MSEVRNPCKCALFGDGQYAGGANKFMRSPFTWAGDTFPNRSAGTLGFRHNGAANVAFCDGHAQSFTHIYTQTTPTEEPKIAPKCGFLSADNSLYDPE